MSADHAALFSSKASDKIVNKQEVDSLQVRNQQHLLVSLFIKCCLVIQKNLHITLSKCFKHFCFQIKKKTQQSKIS